MKKFVTLTAVMLVVSAMTTDLVGAPPDSIEQDIFIVKTPLESRSITFENQTGAKGEGGKAASRLGPGRKGAPAVSVQPGETFTLCDIKGPGVIRHIWVTTSAPPEGRHALVVRAYWEGQKHPSIEMPIDMFFGVPLGKPAAYQSAVHSVNAAFGVNIWVPMPFTKQAKMTVTNEGSKAVIVFYTIDYTVNDRLKSDVGRLHALYRRENPTIIKRDFTILPERSGGPGRFLGTVIGVKTLGPHWFGEGEIKMYMDGDKDYATIVGTGTEDYIGQSWGLQNNAFLYGGVIHNDEDGIAFYRWHIKDPVYWKKSMRITIQQIGYGDDGLFERSDDWRAGAFWYEAVPSAPLPELVSLRERNAPSAAPDTEKKP